MSFGFGFRAFGIDLHHSALGSRHLILAYVIQLWVQGIRYWPTSFGFRFQAFNFRFQPLCFGLCHLDLGSRHSVKAYVIQLWVQGIR